MQRPLFHATDGGLLERTRALRSTPAGATQSVRTGGPGGPSRSRSSGQKKEVLKAVFWGGVENHGVLKRECTVWLPPASLG